MGEQQDKVYRRLSCLLAVFSGGGEAITEYIMNIYPSPAKKNVGQFASWVVLKMEPPKLGQELRDI